MITQTREQWFRPVINFWVELSGKSCPVGPELHPPFDASSHLGILLNKGMKYWDLALNAPGSRTFAAKLSFMPRWSPGYLLLFPGFWNLIPYVTKQGVLVPSSEKIFAGPCPRHTMNCHRKSLQIHAFTIQCHVRENLRRSMLLPYNVMSEKILCRSMLLPYNVMSEKILCRPMLAPHDIMTEITFAGPCSSHDVMWEKNIRNHWWLSINPRKHFPCSC